MNDRLLQRQETCPNVAINLTAAESLREAPVKLPDLHSSRSLPLSSPLLERLPGKSHQLRHSSSGSTITALPPPFASLCGTTALTSAPLRSALPICRGVGRTPSRRAAPLTTCVRPFALPCLPLTPRGGAPPMPGRRWSTPGGSTIRIGLCPGTAGLPLRSSCVGHDDACLSGATAALSSLVLRAVCRPVPPPPVAAACAGAVCPL